MSSEQRDRQNSKPQNSWAKPNERLRYLGFQNDPFAYPEAEKMPPDILEQVFVSHSGFDEHVKDFNRSTVLLAPPGSGKTAGRLRLATTLHRRLIDTLNSRPLDDSFPRTPLVVHYIDFEQIMGRLPDFDLSDHAEPLLTAIAEAVYGFIAEYAQSFIACQQRTRLWWWAFLRIYLKGEPLGNRVQGTELENSVLESTDDYLLFSAESSFITKLELVSTQLAALGIDSLYVLVDGVDGYLQTQQLPNIEILIATLLNTLSLLSLQNVIWKFFLPNNLEKTVRDSAGYRTGRLNVVPVDWDESSLRHLLGIRLAWANDYGVNDLAQVCEQELLVEVSDPGHELARMALHHDRLGPPRALLHLARQLFSRQKGDRMLSLKNWDDFKNAVAKELVPRVFIAYAYEDQSFVERLAKDLKERGVCIWVELSEMGVGDSIVQRMNQEIEESDYILIVLSPDSLQSQWVHEELNSEFLKQISDKKSQVLPVLWRSAELPLAFRNRYYADFRADYPSGLAVLLSLLDPHKTFEFASDFPRIRTWLQVVRRREMESIDRQEFLRLEHVLLKSISEAEGLGDTDDLKQRRNKILERVNILVRGYWGLSFQELTSRQN